MDKLSLEQQLRALALAAAARIVAENVGKFVHVDSASSIKLYTEMAVTDMAKGFERYIKDGAR